MNWLADVSSIWLDWQLRAAVFAIVVVWAGLGTGLRSPVWRCAVLIIGSWILVLFPGLLLVAPVIEIPILVSNERALSNLNGVQGYLAPTLFMLAALATSFLFVRIFKSISKLYQLHASLVEAEVIKPLFDECKTRVGLDADIGSGGRTRCYTSSLTDVPLTFGIRTHYVVLPEGSTSWPEGDLRICLMHELWHVKRADWLSQQVASLASLFNVFNPFAWFLRRQLGKKIEASVDKLCVQSGVDSHQYARVLLQQSGSEKALAGFMSPTYFGAHRYGSADIQQRIGLLVHEPFGWASVPVRELLPLTVLLFLIAVLLCSVQPVPRVEQFFERSNWILLSDFSIEEPGESEMSQVDVGNWRSLQIPTITPAVHSEIGLDDEGGELDYFTQDELNEDPLVEGYDSVNYEILISPTASYYELVLPPNLPPLSMSDIQIPQAPNPLVLVNPRFPGYEASRGREGWVELAYDLDDQGKPISLNVVESSGSRYFERAALAALERSRFDLNPEGLWITRDLTQTYVFQLVDSSDSGVRPRSPP